MWDKLLRLYRNHWYSITFTGTRYEPLNTFFCLYSFWYLGKKNPCEVQACAHCHCNHNDVSPQGCLKYKSISSLQTVWKLWHLHVILAGLVLLKTSTLYKKTRREEKPQTAPKKIITERKITRVRDGLLCQRQKIKSILKWTWSTLWWSGWTELADLWHFGQQKEGKISFLIFNFNFNFILVELLNLQ